MTTLIPPAVHAALDADFEAVLGRAMTPIERAAKRGEREDIERRERWFQMANERKPWDGTVKYLP